MRGSILLWSTFSGAIIGVFVDATVIGAAMLLTALIPGARLFERMQERWIAVAIGVVLVGIPFGLSLLGYLEGQLKTR